MGEIEALIRRRDMLLERILKMNHEIEKLDARLAFLDGQWNLRVLNYLRDRRCLGNRSRELYTLIDFDRIYRSPIMDVNIKQTIYKTKHEIV